MNHLKKALPALLENVALRNRTTMKVGGVADWFIEVKTVEELVSSVRAALKSKIPYFILGNGSNIIFSDSGFPGLVIHNRTSNIAFTDKSQIIVDSGVLISQLILAAASHHLSGLEALFSTPGTIGGAVYGNAGTHQTAIGSLVRSVTLLRPDGKIIRVLPSWMRFAYRTSRLKEIPLTEPKPVILTVRVQFARAKLEDIQKRLAEVKAWRIAKQPLGEFTAGSTFRNPGAGHNFPSTQPSHQTSWSLIRESGAHALRVGDAMPSQKHANFMTNRGKATAREVRDLIEKIKERVREKTGVTLTEEIEYIGHWE